MLTANKYSEWDANDAEFELIEDIIETPLMTTPTKTIESPQWQEDAGETEPQESHSRTTIEHSDGKDMTPGSGESKSTS